MDLEDVKVKESDLKLLETAVKSLRVRSRGVLCEVKILYQQLNDAPNDEEAESKREVGKNRIDNLKVSIWDIQDILDEIAKYKDELEKIIG